MSVQIVEATGTANGPTFQVPNGQTIVNPLTALAYVDSVHRASIFPDLQLLEVTAQYSSWKWKNWETSSGALAVTVYVLYQDETVDLSELTASATYDASIASANRSTLNEAVATAITNGNGLVKIGAGTFPIYTQDTPAAVINAYGDIVIEGAGRDVTILQMGPMTLTADSHLFYVTAGHRLILKNLTILGPTLLTAVELADGTNAHPCMAVFHEGNGAVELENVRTSGQFHAIFTDALSAASGKGAQVKITHSVIGARSQGLFHTEGSDPLTAICEVTDSVVQGDTNIFSGNQHHGLYLNHGVSSRLSGVRFKGFPLGHAVHYLGGTGKARFVDWSQLYFDTDVNYCMLTNRFATTKMSGIGIAAGAGFLSGITVAGPIEASDISFVTQSTANVGYCIEDTVGSAGQAAECSFRGVSFNRGGAAGFLYHIYRAQGTDTTPWFFSDCKHFGVGATGMIMLLDAGRTSFLRSDWYTAVASGDLFSAKIGTHEFEKCRNFTSSTPIMRSQSGNAEYRLYYNDWGISTGSVQFIKDGGGTLTVRGKGNLFGTRGPFCSSTSVIGHMQLPHGLGTATVAAPLLTISEGDGFNLNTAATPAFDDISILNTNAVASANNLHATEITLFAVQAFSLNHNTGSSRTKILTASGQVKTVLANESVKLRFISAANAWVEVAGQWDMSSYAKASLPSAAVAGRQIYVTDETGGATPAFSDGTNWRRVADRAIVS